MAEQQQQASWRIGDWVANPSDDSLMRGDTTVKIEPRVMQVLVTLAESAPGVVSIERLLSEVWSGVVVGPASVYQSVSQLRKTLGDTEVSPKFIENVARKGYRLIAPVQRLQGAIGAASLSSASPIDVVAPTLVRVRTRTWLLPLLAIFILFAAVGLWWRKANQAAQPEANSVVVLPFVDLTADKSERPFCDGLTEEVSNWLGQLPTLNVVARTSAFAYRDKPEDVREIGRQLGTTHALEGSVRRDGSDLRVTIKLVATNSGFQVWAETYDTALTNVLKVQEEIARAVAANLEVRMTADTVNALAARRTVSDQAQRLYLTARYHLQQGTRTNNEQAIALFRRAMQEDANFALAYTGLAAAYINERYYSSRPIAAIVAQVEPLLATAAKLQPNLSELFELRAALETEQFRPQAARQNLLKAIALNPNSVRALAELGLSFLSAGEPRQALEQYSRAALLDPLQSHFAAQRCIALADLAQFDEASRACEHARHLGPKSEWPFTATALLAESQGRIDEALRWNTAALDRSPNLTAGWRKRSALLLVLGLLPAAQQAHTKAMDSLAGDAGPNTRLLELGFQLAFATGGAAALQTEIAATTPAASAAPEIKLIAAEAALLAGDFPLARRVVESAINDSALDPSLLNSPWSARTGQSYLLTVAAAKTLTGDAAGAERYLGELASLLDRLTTGGTRRYGVDELRARVAALRGDGDAAIRALRAAAASGWPGSWRAQHEPYFARLRDRADYRELIGRVDKANAAMRQRWLSAAPTP